MKPAALAYVAAGAVLVAAASFLLAVPQAGLYPWDRAPGAAVPEPFRILDFTADSPVYYSGSEAVFTVGASGGPGNATLRVTGVKDRNGNFRISGERTVEFISGPRLENFTFSMPPCYGCAGVSPGDYGILAELLINGTQACNATVGIRLER